MLQLLDTNTQFVKASAKLKKTYPILTNDIVVMWKVWMMNKSLHQVVFERFSPGVCCCTVLSQSKNYNYKNITQQLKSVKGRALHSACVFFFFTTALSTSTASSACKPSPCFFFFFFFTTV